MRRPGRTMASSPPCHGGCCGFESHPGRHYMVGLQRGQMQRTVNPLPLGSVVRIHLLPPFLTECGQRGMAPNLGFGISCSFEHCHSERYFYNN